MCLAGELFFEVGNAQRKSRFLCLCVKLASFTRLSPGFEEERYTSERRTICKKSPFEGGAARRFARRGMYALTTRRFLSRSAPFGMARVCGNLDFRRGLFAVARADNNSGIDKVEAFS